MINSKTIVEEFIETHRHLFPEASPKQIEYACKHPFHFVRQIISDNSLSTVKLMHLGMFKVSPGRARHLLRGLQAIPDKYIPNNDGSATLFNLRPKVLDYLPNINEQDEETISRKHALINSLKRIIAEANLIPFDDDNNHNDEEQSEEGPSDTE